jgi:hypothetical protein
VTVSAFYFFFSTVTDVGYACLPKSQHFGMQASDTVNMKMAID